MTKFPYWTAYFCAPSTVSAGRRAAHDTGCGYLNVKGHKEPITESNEAQGSPCKSPACTNRNGKRQRLNPGNIWMDFTPESHPHMTNAERQKEARQYANEDNEKVLAFHDRYPTIKALMDKNPKITLEECQEVWPGIQLDDPNPQTSIWCRTLRNPSPVSEETVRESISITEEIHSIVKQINELGEEE